MLTASGGADVDAETAPSSTLTVLLSAVVAGVGDGSVVAAPVSLDALIGAGVSAAVVGGVGSAYVDSPGAVALADSIDSAAAAAAFGANVAPEGTSASAPASASP